MPYKTILTGLLAVSLTACGTLSAPPPQIVRNLPPAELLADCPVPVKPSDRSNAALAQWLRAYDSSLESCNADKASLREWAK